MNTQKPSKIDHKRDGISHALEVTEVFDTIQGEGPWSGLPCTFIRLAGCTLQCTWCDTNYTAHYLHNIVDLLALTRQRHVVITGGEPMRQHISPLIEALVEEGHRVQIETSGTCIPHDFPWELCTVVCSPKTRVHREILNHCRHWKFVVDRDTDYTLSIGPTQPKGKSAPVIPFTAIKGQIYAMPLTDENEDANIKKAVELCMKYGYTLTLRLHKILGLP